MAFFLFFLFLSLIYASYTRNIVSEAGNVGTKGLIVLSFFIVLVKLRPRSHVKSCFLMYNGNLSSVHNPNWGKVGPTGFPGAPGILARLSQTREDSGSCLIERRH